MKIIYFSDQTFLTMNTILIALIYTFAPLLLLYGCKRFSWLNKFGTVALAYMLGIIIANTGLIKPEMAAMQDNYTSITIVLAIPLLLFSVNLKQWSRLALKTGLSVIFGIVSVLIIIVIGHYLLKNKIPDCWQVSGLMVGVYLGATANMAAIMKALNGDPNTFILANAYDILICIGYFFFLITKAQKVLGKILVPFKPANPDNKQSEDLSDFDGWDSYRGIHKKKVLIPLLMALLLSGGIVGLSLFLKQFFPAGYETAGIIITITGLSILMSIIPAVNKIKKTFQSGMYLIIIFCIVVGSMADFSKFTMESLYIGAFVATVVFGSFILQVFFSKLLKIDVDTTIITSTAFIFSPPFVPTVASALKNKEIILSGITIGIIGYATGNFLGITLAYFLR